MTNANLDGIAQVSGGNEITLNYQGGSQKVFVPPARRSSPSTPARAPTSAGEWIWTNARQEADGKIVAERLNVSKDGVKPPH